MPDKIDVSLIRSTDSEDDRNDATIFSKQKVRNQLFIWRSLFNDVDTLRKEYIKGDEIIEIRSNAPSHAHIVQIHSTEHMSYDLDTNRDELVVTRVTIRGKHMLMIDELANYEEMAALLFSCCRIERERHSHVTDD